MPLSEPLLSKPFLSQDDLKVWLHKKLTQKDKLLLILSTKSAPCSPADMRHAAALAGLRIPTTWNISATLGKSGGLAINIPDGWEITEPGLQHLRNLGVSHLSPSSVKVATDLRNHLKNIGDTNVRAFVEEAIKCHEAELYRSAIVMAWLAAIAVLHSEVISNHLSAFNAEATKIDQKWKPAKTSDDLGRMKEGEFLDRIAAISVIGKNTKEELQKALKLRNGCGHPSSLKVGPNAVANHIELLLLNVFDVFCK